MNVEREEIVELESRRWRMVEEKTMAKPIPLFDFGFGHGGVRGFGILPTFERRGETVL